jgi:hypothetical protein
MVFKGSLSVLGTPIMCHVLRFDSGVVQTFPHSGAAGPASFFPISLARALSVRSWSTSRRTVMAVKLPSSASGAECWRDEVPLAHPNPCR